MSTYTFEDVLDGEPNVDHKGEVRWRFTNKDDTPFYFTEDELGSYFEVFQNEMDDCFMALQISIRSR